MMYKKCCTHQFPAASWQVVSQQKTPCALGHNTSSKSCNPDFRVSQQIPLTEWVYPMKCILLEWEELLKNRFLSYGHPECILQRNLLVQIEFVFVAFIALQVGISLVVRNNQWKRKDRLVTCPTGRSDLKRTSRSNMIRLNEWPLRKKEKKTEKQKETNILCLQNRLIRLSISCPKKIDSYPTFNPSWSMDLRSPTMPWEHPRGWSNLHPNTPGCLKAGCPKKINQIKATVHPTWNLQISDILHFQIHKLHVCFAFASQILTCPWRKRYLYHVKGLLTFLVFHTFTFQTIFSKNLCAGSRQSNWPIKKEANLANWL